MVTARWEKPTGGIGFPFSGGEKPIFGVGRPGFRRRLSSTKGVGTSSERMLAGNIGGDPRKLRK